MSKRLRASAGYGDSAAAALLRRLPDSVERRHLRDLVDELEAAYVERIDAAARSFKPDDARAFMLRFLGAAMRAGNALAGYPGEADDDELADLAALVEAELRYLSRYADSAHEDVRSRSRLYGGAVTSAFYRGWLHRLPTTIELVWWLGAVVEHCQGGTGPGPCRGGCVRLQAEGPYDLPGRGSNPLPTVPRGGDTFCNANCRCFVTARYRDGREIGPEPEIGAEVTALGVPGLETTRLKLGIGPDRELVPASPVDPTGVFGRDLAAPLQDPAERIAYWQRLASAGAPDSRTRPGLLRAQADFARLARERGLTARLTATLPEVLQEVSRAKVAGMRWLDPAAGQDWHLAIGVVLAIILARRGVVTAPVEAWSVGLGPAAVVAGGTTYRLDELGRNLAFVVPHSDSPPR